MLPGVFNLIAFALVPLTAHVVNGEPHPPFHEGPEIVRLPPPHGRPEIVRLPPPHGHPEVVILPQPHGRPEIVRLPPPHRRPEVVILPQPHGRPEIVRLPPPHGRPEVVILPQPHGRPEIVRLPPPPPFHGRPETGHGGHRKRDWKPMEVTRNFQSYQSRVSNYGPIFENACQNNHPEVLVNGLVDIRTSLVSLSAQVHVSVGAWAIAEIHACADKYASLLAKVQVVLEIIHAHHRVDSCRDSILGLNVPLQALVSVFVKAGINVGLLLGARVNLSLLASIGISLGISANVEL